MKSLNIMLICAILILISGCATVVKNNSAVCQTIHFDFNDDGLLNLNLHNKKAVKSFTEICDSGV